jgi:hypothetical protein
MNTALQLDKMSTEEKLRVMEEIWTSLERNAENVPSPTWHADVLAAREQRIKNGTAAFSDWDDAKKRIRESI